MKTKQPWPVTRREQFILLRRLISECTDIHGSHSAARMERIHKLTGELTRDHLDAPVEESFMAWLSKQAVGD